jgi:arachidonate 15-lipoxygenase
MKIDFRLPQHDDSPIRAETIKSFRAMYKYRMDYGVPVADGFRMEDMPGREWQVKAQFHQEMQHLNLRSLVRSGKWHFPGDTPQFKPLTLVKLLQEKDFAGIFHYFVPKMGIPTNDARASSLDDFRAIFAKVPLPAVADTFQSDETFAEYFVAGPDPTRLARLDAVPAKFPITTEHLRTVPGLSPDVDLQAEIRAGRAFWVDYEAMNGLGNGTHPLGPKYMYSPMIAFVARPDGIKPFAIQCGQDPTGRKIYTPADGWSWKMARNCVLVAHNTYQVVVTHLGRTHLLSEAILLATVRNLAPQHPVAALLHPHFEGTFSINRLAVDLLIQPGEAVEQMIGSSLAGAYRLLADKRKNYSYRGNYLPSRFARHRTDSLATLARYPYRDDGLLVWNAIARWAADFVGAYYGADADVRGDFELQAWAAEIASPDWGQVSDFGATPGAISDRQDLAEILTMVMWTAGPQHAAVNFPQADYMSFLPANPQAGFSPEPTGMGHTQRDWLAQFPPIDVAIQQFTTLTFLSSVNYTRLGEYGSNFSGTAAEAANRRFRAALADVEDKIATANTARAFNYPYLLPSQIPASTNI